MNNMKVMILEDEAIIALEIQRVIMKLGYEVTSKPTSYEDAIKSVSENRPDIAILDIDLSKSQSSKNGIQTAKEIINSFDIPIIFLTGNSDVSTLEEASSIEPISYINKPFKRDDIKTALFFAQKYLEKRTSKIIKKIGYGYYYNLNKKLLYQNDEIIKLSNNENKLLKLLLDADGQIVTMEEIEYEVWSNNAVGNSSLRTLIYRLRNKLGHGLVDTIQAVGCRLVIKK